MHAVPLHALQDRRQALDACAVTEIDVAHRCLRIGTELQTKGHAEAAECARSDAIDDTLNYKSVAKRVLAFVESSRYQLVEALAGEIARIVLEEFKVARVKVTVHKPGAIRHSRDVGVVIERARDG